MKIKAILLILTVSFSTAIFAQKKSAVKNSKINPSPEQTIKKSQTEEKINENSIAVQEDAADKKFGPVIDKYSSRISELERMLTEKMKAYQSDEKMKKNTAVIDEINNARLTMLTELIGEDAAKYYISKHKMN